MSRVLPPLLRFGSLFIPTRRESPHDAVFVSHQLLVRAGFIRVSTAKGVYTLLPLALRVLAKMEGVIDRHLSAIGCQKLAMPILLDAEDWKKTGRWESTGEELMKCKDRHGHEYCLAPTHEEVITRLVASEVSLARQLPMRLYQTGRKFRDEIRPRSGLLRSREFIMKDLYTFDNTQKDAFDTYDEVNAAYERCVIALH